jgi:hypothetical protein
LLIYNTNFYYRLALSDVAMDYESYARQRRFSSTSSSSRSHQSRDDQNEETLRRHMEMMQYIISMKQATIFKYLIFPIL